MYLAMALSLAWLFLSFASHPHQGLFAFLLCMYPNWLLTPASVSQRLVLQACSLMLGTWVVPFPLWTGPMALSWSWAWLIHPCHSTFRAQLRSCPIALLCLLFPLLVLFFPVPFALCPVVSRAEAGLFPWALCCGSHVTAPTLSFAHRPLSLDFSWAPLISYLLLHLRNYSLRSQWSSGCWGWG